MHSNILFFITGTEFSGLVIMFEAGSPAIPVILYNLFHQQARGVEPSPGLNGISLLIIQIFSHTDLLPGAIVSLYTFLASLGIIVIIVIPGPAARGVIAGVPPCPSDNRCKAPCSPPGKRYSLLHPKRLPSLPS